MHISKLYRISLSLAMGAALTASAGVFEGSTDFESPFALTPAEEAAGASLVSETPTVAAADRPANYTYAETRATVLAVDNDTATPYVRNLTDGTAQTGTIYADLLVKPEGVATATFDASEKAANTDKLLIYFKETSAGVTNLCVYAGGYVSGDDKCSCSAPDEYVLTSSASPAANNWYRLVVVALEDADGVNVGTAPGYEIYLGGYGDGFLCSGTGKDGFTTSKFLAINNTPGTMSAIGFAGNGRVDDLVLTTYDPALQLATLTWDPTLESVSYTVNGAAGDPLTASAGSYVCQIPDGATVVMTGNNGYRTFSTTGTALVSPTGIEKYTDQIAGAGTEQDPYLVPNYAALVAVKDAVADAAAFRSAYYVQTADIDGTGKPAFAGIGTYNKIPTSGTPFTGTYDGQGYMISNITMTARNYGGVFNQVNGGTIKDLTVADISVESGATGEYGYAIVGYAANGATLQGLTASGSFLSAGNPATHNAAGIAIRANGGASGKTTSFIDCTNNAAIYGNYTKIGGICTIAQKQDNFGAGIVAFSGCVNNGNVIKSAGSNDTNGGFGGILAYATDNSETFVNCVNNGTVIADNGAAFHVGQIVGHMQDYTLTDNGGNAAADGEPMVGYIVGGTVNGFQYATVANDVATTIAPPYTLVKDTTYLLEGNAAPTVMLASGESITFNTALGYTLDDAGITAAEGLAVTSNTVGTVTTYATEVPITLSPASLELYPNCSNYVYVVNAPEGSTYKFTFAGNIGSGGYGPTIGWGKPYGKAPGSGTVTAIVSNNNEQVAQLVCNVTVKDVVAVVDGTEYATAEWDDAVAAALANDKVLEVYWKVANIYLTGGQTLRWKAADNRGSASATILAAPATESAMYKVTSTKDNATGITTAVCTNEGAPNVMITKANGDVSYSATLSMSAAGATYKLLRSFTQSTAVGADKADMTLDLNGQTLTLASHILVRNLTKPASLTIVDNSVNGNGTIVGGDEAIWATDGDSVTIAGGNFSATATIVYTYNGGMAIISNGTFSVTQSDKKYLLNCNDSNRGTITVVGGKFNAFDPMNSNDGDLVDPAYASLADSPSAGWYTVVPAFAVTWKDYDGSVLESDPRVATGATPSYDSAEPTRAADAGNTYAFAGWTPAIAAVSGNAIYTATYTATPIPVNKHEDENGSSFTLEVASLPTPMQDALAAAEVSNLDTTVPGKGYTYAEGLALGLITADGNNLVTADLPAAEISFDSEGNPVVTFGENGMGNASFNVVCKLFGKAALSDEWSADAVATGAPGATLTDDTDNGYHFYKVVVVITDAE